MRIEVYALQVGTAGIMLLPPEDDTGDAECFMAFKSAKEASLALKAMIDKGLLDAGECSVIRVA